MAGQIHLHAELSVLLLLLCDTHKHIDDLSLHLHPSSADVAFDTAEHWGEVECGYPQFVPTLRKVITKPHGKFIVIVLEMLLQMSVQ